MDRMEIRSRLDEALSKNKVLVMSHRGVVGANIVDNTVEAFEAALQGGADMLEMDVCASTDGELFVIHDGTEPMLFGSERNVTTMTASEIRSLRFLNKHRTCIEHAPNTFDEVLEHLRGRTVINLDRCWNIWPAVLEKVKDHHMEDQVLLKSPCAQKYIDYLDACETKFMYDPFIMEPEELDLLKGKDVNLVCVQIDAYHEGDADMEPAFLHGLEEQGICRSICAMTLGYPYSRETMEGIIRRWSDEKTSETRAKIERRIRDGGQRPANGRDDDRSVLGDPDGGWGWLIERGFNVLMTDWPVQMAAYLRQKGLKKA